MGRLGVEPGPHFPGVHTYSLWFTGLSSYTPKHSMAFSKWQEQTLVQSPNEVELPLKEVMVSQVERGVNTQTPKGWPTGEGVMPGKA